MNFVYIYAQQAKIIIIIIVINQPLSSPWLLLQDALTPVILHTPLFCHGLEKRQAVQTFQILVPDMEHHY